MKRLFLSVLILALSISSIRAQQDTVALAKMSRFVQNINTFNQLIPREKVYVHFDNTGYYLGETIWFKAYVVRSLSFLATDQSGVLYVELLNSKGKLLETKKLKIEDGQCHSEFVLSTSNFDYFPGLYEIRAYTKTMLNFGEEVVFSRVFPVFTEPETEGDYTNTNLDMKNSDEESFLKNYRKKAEKMDKVDVTFYPEGGNSVKGLLSTVAFKVTDKEGQNLEVSGDVYSADGQAFATFSTKYGGMGTFDYIPDGKKNKVKIRYEDKEHTFDLPQALPKGYVMKVNNFQKQNLMLQVTKSPDLPTIPLGVSVLCRGQVFFFDMVEPGGEPAVLKIPKADLPIGTNQITLFDAKGEVYAERLVFISPGEAELAKIKAVPNKESYKKNERITIDFTVAGKSVSPHNSFSVSVSDASLTPDMPDAGNIATNFLLSSELKGFIENPSYYFESNDAARIQALDLLMMVQGWKQYEWKQMAGVKPFTHSFDTEKSLVVKGLIKGKTKEIKISMRKDTLYMDDTVVPDNKGVFYAYPEDFYGTWTLSIHPEGGFEDAYKNVRLDRWFSPDPQSYSFYEKKNDYGMGEKKKKEKKKKKDEQPDTEEIQSIDGNKQYLLPTVQVDEKRGKDVIYDVARDIDRAIDLGERGWSGNVHDFLVANDKRYIFKAFGSRTDLDNITPANKQQALRTIKLNLDDISVTDNDITANDVGSFYYDRKYQIQFFHYDNSAFRSGDTNQSVDVSMWKTDNRGMTEKELGIVNLRQPEFNFTVNRNILEVQKIIISPWDTHSSNTAYSFQSIPAYIYPYVNHQMRAIPSVRYTTFEGYSKAKDFYDKKPGREEYKPAEYEHSRTLYWNPDVQTDNEGKAQISFYNNVQCKKISISAEGISKEGMPITIAP
jgi:hypothetical protein